MSFLIPANLRDFKSVTTNDMIFGWTSLTSSGIGRILFPSKYFSYFALISLKFFGHFWEVIFSVHDAGSEGTFWAGGMVLAGESDGHLFSGFEGGVSPSKISVSDGDGDCDGDVASAIVAYQATRREKQNKCSCYNSCEKRVNDPMLK